MSAVHSIVTSNLVSFVDIDGAAKIRSLAEAFSVYILHIRKTSIGKTIIMFNFVFNSNECYNTISLIES